MDTTSLSYDGEGADLDALVDQVLGTRPRPIDWARMDEADLADAWEALEEWVRWLVTRYCLDHREIPPCWQDHGALVEELSALHTAHQAAYDPAGPPAGPAEWHQLLAGARARLQLWVARTGCRPAEHREHPPPAWVTEHPS